MEEKLSAKERLREQILDELAEYAYDNFRSYSSLEARDVFRHGITALDELTDKELVDEVESYGFYEDEHIVKITKKFQAEIEVHKVLQGNVVQMPETIYGVATGEQGTGVGDIVSGTKVEEPYPDEGKYLDGIQVYYTFKIVDNKIVVID